MQQPHIVWNGSPYRLDILHQGMKEFPLRRAENPVPQSHFPEQCTSPSVCPVRFATWNCAGQQKLRSSDYL